MTKIVYIDFIDTCIVVLLILVCIKVRLNNNTQ